MHPNRAVYWASFFHTIQYNTFSCDIWYIGWTICLNIFDEKDQKRPRKVMAHLYSIDFVICVWHLADLVTNLLWHWWWTVIFVFNQMLQLFRTQITFVSIVLFLRWILSKFDRYKPFLNFARRARWLKVLFSNPTLYWRIVKTMYGISHDRRIPVRIDISIYWFTPTSQLRRSWSLLSLFYT